MFHICTVAIVSIAMASEVTIRDHLEVVDIHSYSRGYHAYIDIWTPTVSEILLVKRIPIQWLYIKVSHQGSRSPLSDIFHIITPSLVANRQL